MSRVTGMAHFQSASVIYLDDGRKIAVTEGVVFYYDPDQSGEDWDKDLSYPHSGFVDALDAELQKYGARLAHNEHGHRILDYYEELANAS